MHPMNKPLFINVLSRFLSEYYIEQGLKPQTIYNYRSRYAFILGFLQKSKKIEITIDEVSIEFIADFKLYCHKKLDLTQYSRNVELIKKVLNYSIDKGYLYDNKLRQFKRVREKVKEVIHLSKEELNSFRNTDTIYLTQKYLYLFECYTGLSYGDLWSYRIVKRKGIEWITGKRCKTGKDYFVFMRPELKEILEEMKTHFPNYPKRLTYLAFNEGLRKIAAKAGIKKHLTSHTGRKTFATLMYEDGWTAESIADMMGITIQILFEHYIKRGMIRVETELLKRQIC